MEFNLKIWRQKNAKAKGHFETYHIEGIEEDASFLEMLDILNEQLIREGCDPVAVERGCQSSGPVSFDHDCREGICGACSLYIDGRAHGDQTDTIYKTLSEGHCYRHALKTRAFEPDAPNFTPRISGVITPVGTYNLSILKTMDNDETTCQRFFFEYDAPKNGVGHFISTYQGDGSPLPSFCGEPIPVEVDCNEAQPWADKVWEALNPENKVSLFVRFLDLHTREVQDVICNKHH